jgi:hypothetical protein
VDKVVQSSLFNEDNILLRSTPSPQVDAAWEALADVGVIVITAEEVIRLGKDPNKTVRAPVEWGKLLPAVHLQCATSNMLLTTTCTDSLL